jgi:hypothetical protein
MSSVKYSEAYSWKKENPDDDDDDDDDDAEVGSVVA